MAPDEPNIASDNSQPAAKPTMLDNDHKKRPRWLRWVGMLALVVVGVFAFFVLIGVLVGKPKADVTDILRRASNDSAFATRAGLAGKVGETALGDSASSTGLKAVFDWPSQTRGAEFEIATFETAEQAQAAFDLFRANSSGSLLVPDTEGTIVYGEFSKGRVDSPVTKVFRCAERRHDYACGSVHAGAPAIVIVRLAVDAEWQQTEGSDEDPMVVMQRKFAKSDAAAEEIGRVDTALLKLGIGSPRGTK